jgi:hypothetical protein
MDENSTENWTDPVDEVTVCVGMMVLLGIGVDELSVGVPLAVVDGIEVTAGVGVSVRDNAVTVAEGTAVSVGVMGSGVAV